MQPAHASPTLQQEVLLCAHGDRHAFRALYEATHVRVARAVKRIVRDEHLADEVIADTFLQAWRRASSYSPSRSSVVSWLTMIARSRALDAVRSHTRLRARLASLEGAEHIGSDEDVGASAEAQEVTRQLADSLRRLPLKQQEAIRATYFHGLTHREAADRLKQPLGTVKTRVRLGLASLRRSLDGRGSGKA